MRSSALLLPAILFITSCATNLAYQPGSKATAGTSAAPVAAPRSAPAPVAREKADPKRPAWIDLKVPFRIEDESIVALGQTVTPPGAGVEEGYIIAGNAANEAICKATQYRLDLAFQETEEGSTIDRDQIKEIAMDACTGVAAITEPGKKYWEKVLTTASNGDRVIVYRVFVTNVIPEKKYRSLILGSIRKQEGKGRMPKDYAKEFRKRWKQFAKGE